MRCGAITWWSKWCLRRLALISPREAFESWTHSTVVVSKAAQSRACGWLACDCVVAPIGTRPRLAHVATLLAFNDGVGINSPSHTTKFSPLARPDRHPSQASSEGFALISLSRHFIILCSFSGWPKRPLASATPPSTILVLRDCVVSPTQKQSHRRTR